MKPIARLLSALALLAVLTACGSAATPTPAAQPSAVPTERPTLPMIPTTPPATSAPEARPIESFFVRPEGAKGPLVMYDMTDGSARFTLPAGVLSADGKHYFATTKIGDDTRLNQYDPGTGAETLSAKVPGQWELSGVSPTGRWAALTRLFSDGEKQTWTAANERQTEVQILDTRTGQPAHRVGLDGNFEVDGLSSLGDSLFLIQYLPAVNPDHYQIRLYDLSAEELQDGALVDKRAADEVMAGQAWEGVASPDGQWLLTLYLRTKHHSAFIHALDLENKFTFCIDLPSGNGDFEKLKYYTLALAPDGQTIYAANAALGMVAKVSLNDLSVTSAAQFQANPSIGTLAAYNPQTPSRSLVSKDGQAVYFTDGMHAWAYDTKSGKVSLYQISAPISGLGVSGDGKRLYVARADQSLMVLDAVSGEALSLQKPSTSSR